MELWSQWSGSPVCSVLRFSREGLYERCQAWQHTAAKGPGIVSTPFLVVSCAERKRHMHPPSSVLGQFLPGGFRVSSLSLYFPFTHRLSLPFPQGHAHMLTHTNSAPKTRAVDQSFFIFFTFCSCHTRFFVLLARITFFAPPFFSTAFLQANYGKLDTKPFSFPTPYPPTAGPIRE